MTQSVLYEPIKSWLTGQGFRALITGGQERNMVIPVNDLAPAPYMIPDLLGVDGHGRVVVVEVEKDKERFFDALGRCMLWKCFATYVWLAYPKDKTLECSCLKKLGVGFLSVDADSGSVVDKLPLPQDGDLFSILELHPTDVVREQELANRLRSTLK